jgi:uncharacterized protein YbaP (TraB family)
MIKKLLIIPVVIFVVVAAHAQQTNTFLWRISNPDNINPSYLFGTIHLPQEKFMLLTDSVYDAIGKTDCFYGELDFLNVFSEMKDNEAFFQSKLDYLDSVKKTSSWRRMINSINRTYQTSIDPDSLEQFTQFGQNILGEFMKPDPGVTGLDIALASYASTLGKPTKGLETFVLQIDMLYKIIDARLTDTTLLFNDDIALTSNLKQYYSDQKFDSLSTLIEHINPSYKKIVFDNRNITMADSIKNISTNQSAFFAVGCGHLLGTNGLIKILTSKGLQLAPVYSGNKLSITLMKQLFETGIKNMRKEIEKDSEYVKPEEPAVEVENMEEVKEDVMISTVKPATKKSTPKKTSVKKLKPPAKKQ